MEEKRNKLEEIKSKKIQRLSGEKLKTFLYENNQVSKYHFPSLDAFYDFWASGEFSCPDEAKEKSLEIYNIVFNGSAEKDSPLHHFFDSLIFAGMLIAAKNIAKNHGMNENELQIYDRESFR